MFIIVQSIVLPGPWPGISPIIKGGGGNVKDDLVGLFPPNPCLCLVVKSKHCSKSRSKWDELVEEVDDEEEEDELDLRAESELFPESCWVNEEPKSPVLVGSVWEVGKEEETREEGWFNPRDWDAHCIEVFLLFNFKSWNKLILSTLVIAKIMRLITKQKMKIFDNQEWWWILKLIIKTTHTLDFNFWALLKKPMIHFFIE